MEEKREKRNRTKRGPRKSWTDLADDVDDEDEELEQESVSSYEEHKVAPKKPAAGEGRARKRSASAHAPRVATSPTHVVAVVAEEDDNYDDIEFGADEANSSASEGEDDGRKPKKRSKSVSAHSASSRKKDSQKMLSIASLKQAPTKKKKKNGVELHPASIPCSAGRCFLANPAFVNQDIKRKLCAYLDRQAITALSLTCKSFRSAILSSPLKSAIIPTMSKPNSHCPWCSKFRKMNRSATCSFGHEVHMHHSCMKHAIQFTWNRDLGLAVCSIPKCGAPLVEYGKDKSCYKGNRRAGILTALFKTVGRGTFRYNRVFAMADRGDCAIQ